MAARDPAATFEAYKPALVEAGANGGAAVVERIASLPDGRDRLVLYTLARRIFVIEGGMPGGLDIAIDIADAGVAEVEAMLAAGASEEQRRDLLRALHVLNFNLAADLCDCWPDDDRPREQRHHERGLEAAEYLVGGAFAGMVLPRVLANDWWVKGMHELSLGHAVAARESWTEALDAASERARREGVAEGGPEAPPQLALIRGYLAVATWLTPEGEERNAALAAFREAADVFAAKPEDAEARYNLGQLQKVRARYAAGLAAE